jgi:hypothetical protein
VHARSQTSWYPISPSQLHDHKSFQHNMPTDNVWLTIACLRKTRLKGIGMEVSCAVRDLVVTVAVTLRKSWGIHCKFWEGGSSSWRNLGDDMTVCRARSSNCVRVTSRIYCCGYRIFRWTRAKRLLSRLRCRGKFSQSSKVRTALSLGFRPISRACDRVLRPRQARQCHPRVIESQ